MRALIRAITTVVVLAGGFVLGARQANAQPECSNTRCIGSQDCSYRANSKCSVNSDGTECTIAGC